MPNDICEPIQFLNFVIQNNRSEVDAQIRAGIDLNQRYNGLTALDYALIYNQHEMVRHLRRHAAAETLSTERVAEMRQQLFRDASYETRTDIKLRFDRNQKPELDFENYKIEPNREAKLISRASIAYGYLSQIGYMQNNVRIITVKGSPSVGLFDTQDSTKLMAVLTVSETGELTLVSAQSINAGLRIESIGAVSVEGKVELKDLAVSALSIQTMHSSKIELSTVDMTSGSEILLRGNLNAEFLMVNCYTLRHDGHTTVVQVSEIRAYNSIFQNGVLNFGRNTSVSTSLFENYSNATTQSIGGEIRIYGSNSIVNHGSLSADHLVLDTSRLVNHNGAHIRANDGVLPHSVKEFNHPSTILIGRNPPTANSNTGLKWVSNTARKLGAYFMAHPMIGAAGAGLAAIYFSVNGFSTVIAIGSSLLSPLPLFVGAVAFAAVFGYQYFNGSNPQPAVTEPAAQPRRDETLDFNYDDIEEADDIETFEALSESALNEFLQNLQLDQLFEVELKPKDLSQYVSKRDDTSNLGKYVKRTLYAFIYAMKKSDSIEDNNIAEFQRHTATVLDSPEWQTLSNRFQHHALSYANLVNETLLLISKAANLVPPTTHHHNEPFQNRFIKVSSGTYYAPQPVRLRTPIVSPIVSVCNTLCRALNEDFEGEGYLFDFARILHKEHILEEVDSANFIFEAEDNLDSMESTEEVDFEMSQTADQTSTINDDQGATTSRNALRETNIGFLDNWGTSQAEFRHARYFSSGSDVIEDVGMRLGPTLGHDSRNVIFNGSESARTLHFAHDRIRQERQLSGMGRGIEVARDLAIDAILHPVDTTQDYGETVFDDRNAFAELGHGVIVLNSEHVFTRYERPQLGSEDSDVIIAPGPTLDRHGESTVIVRHWHDAPFQNESQLGQSHEGLTHSNQANVVNFHHDAALSADFGIISSNVVNQQPTFIQTGSYSNGVIEDLGTSWRQPREQVSHNDVIINSRENILDLTDSAPDVIEGSARTLHFAHDRIRQERQLPTPFRHSTIEIVDEPLLNTSVENYESGRFLPSNFNKV